MGLKKTEMIVTGFIGVLVCTFLLSLTPVSGEAWASSKWIWSKENPKPVWWTWGKDYWPEEPVRGGMLRLAASN